MANMIDAITNPLKSAGETAQRLMDLRDTAKFGEAVIDLQAQILSAQQGALAAQQREATMAEEIRTLKETVTDLEAWESEKEKYELTELPPGVFVYALKGDEDSGTPPHKLCPNCYEARKKSIRQGDEPNNGVTRLHCLSCGAEIRTGHWRPPPIADLQGGDGITGY